MKRMLRSVVAALMMIVPAAAFAADGYVITNVNMRAGPDPGYPVVQVLPTNAWVSVQGCTTGVQQPAGVRGRLRVADRYSHRLLRDRHVLEHLLPQSPLLSRPQSLVRAPPADPAAGEATDAASSTRWPTGRWSAAVTAGRQSAATTTAATG